MVALVFTPFFSDIPPSFLQLIAAPALITVGILMMAPIKMIDFSDLTQAIPATLTIAFMLFTYNIGFGLAAGLVAYLLAKTAAGRRNEVHPLAWVLWVLGVFTLYCLPLPLA